MAGKGTVRLFSGHCAGRHVLLICPTTWCYVNLLVKVKSARFSHCKVIILLCAIFKYLVENTLKSMQMSCVSSNFYSLVLVSKPVQLNKDG